MAITPGCRTVRFISENSFTGGIPTAEIRSVCAPCNGGWMSSIETRARPLLEAMMRREPVELHADAQEALSVWACLKTIVGHTLTEGRRLASADWRRYLYKSKRPPGDWFVGVTGFTGTVQAYFDIRVENFVRDVIGKDGKARERPAGTEVFASMIIRGLAIKVFGLRQSQLQPPRPDALLPIWPSSSRVLFWPPPNSVDDDTMERFLNVQIGS